MDDDGFELPQGTGTYIVLGTVCLALLLRTNGEAFPTGLDVTVSMLFGGLALALVKLASYTFREYILDLLQSGDATTQVVSGATQTPTVYVPSDRPASGAKSSPPSIRLYANGNFLTHGRKQVLLSNEEFEQLDKAINLSVDELGEVAKIDNRDLYVKLKGLGLVDGSTWTTEAMQLFGIPPKPFDDRPLDDYDFIPGEDGEVEWEKMPSTISPV